MKINLKISQEVKHNSLGKGVIVNKYINGPVAFVDIKLEKFRITNEGIKTNAYRCYYRKDKSWK